MAKTANPEYVTAKEAAVLLGVSLSTLYVYVGRKGLRSKAVPNSRARMYLKADLDREVLRKSVQRSSSDAGLDSIVTQITADGPLYRGSNAIQLSAAATIEDAASLLWNVEVIQAFGRAEPRGLPNFQARVEAFVAASSVERATALLHTLEEADPRSFELTPLGMARTGGDIMRWLAALLFKRPGATAAPIHEVVGEALGLDAARVELTRRLLVLAADHGLEPGARAVRAMASTGVTPWRSVTTGLLVAAGRQGWYGHAFAVRQLLDEILATAEVRQPILARLRQGDRIPGFGSSLYGGHDPRAKALVDSCFELLPADTDLERLKAALELVREWTGFAPDFPFVRAYVSRKLAVDRSDPLYALARSAGWIAHSIEQYAAEERMRPGRDRSLMLRDDASHHVV